MPIFPVYWWRYRLRLDHISPLRLRMVLNGVLDASLVQMLKCLTGNKSRCENTGTLELKRRENLCNWDGKGFILRGDSFSLASKSHQTPGLGGLSQTHSFSGLSLSYIFSSNAKGSRTGFSRCLLYTMPERTFKVRSISLQIAVEHGRQVVAGKSLLYNMET